MCYFWCALNGRTSSANNYGIMKAQFPGCSIRSGLYCYHKERGNGPIENKILLLFRVPPLAGPTTLVRTS